MELVIEVDLLTHNINEEVVASVWRPHLIVLEISDHLVIGNKVAVIRVLINNLEDLAGLKG
jgi:hypothetical protein